MGGVCEPVPCGCAGPAFALLANGVYDNKNGKDFYADGPDGSEPMDDLRTPAEDEKLEIVSDDPSYYWEARYADLGGGNVCNVEVVVQVRREQDAAGSLRIDVYSGGLLEAAETIPLSSVVDDSNMSVPPDSFVVFVPLLGGDPVSVVNELTLRVFVQSGNGKKVWWSYTEVKGTNP